MAKNGIFYKLGRAISAASGRRGFDPSSGLGPYQPKQEILEDGKELSQCFYCGDATTTTCSICGKSICIKHRKDLPDFTNRSDGRASFCKDCAASVKLNEKADRPKPQINKKAISNIICCVIATLIMTLSWFFF